MVLESLQTQVVCVDEGDRKRCSKEGEQRERMALGGSRRWALAFQYQQNRFAVSPTQRRPREAAAAAARRKPFQFLLLQSRDSKSNSRTFLGG